MASYNKMVIIGNVGGDPEMRITPSGAPVTSFSVAVSEKVKGEQVTQWFRCAAWGSKESEGLAGIIAQYVHKGDSIYIEGPLRLTSFTKDGVDRQSLEITVREMKMLSSKQTQEESTPEPF